MYILNIVELLSKANNEKKMRILQAKKEFDNAVMSMPEKEQVADTLDGKLNNRFKGITDKYRKELKAIADEIIR